jgi:DNA topoisomerase VI subunit B
MMARRRKTKKSEADTRIERAYYATCSGITIPMMSIPKVFAYGRMLVEEGADDEALAKGIHGFVVSIAVA